MGFRLCSANIYNGNKQEDLIENGIWSEYNTTQDILSTKVRTGDFSQMREASAKSKGFGNNVIRFQNPK